MKLQNFICFAVSKVLSLFQKGNPMILIITEKNSVATEIAKAIGATTKQKCDKAHKQHDYFEGNGYLISWCVGHLIRLCDPAEYDEKFAKWDIDALPIMPQFYKTKVDPQTAARYQVLKDLMNRPDVDELVCATDAAREGELIFRLVYNQAHCKKPFKRLWISSMSAEAIQQGMAELVDGHDYDDLYHAAESRQQADWLIGMNLTRLYTKVYGTKLPIGRVKTPTVALLVQRDQEIKNFVKTPYYSLTADCGTFKAYAQMDDKDAAEAAAAAGNAAGTALIKTVDTSEKSERPPLLYDLTSLQQDANQYFGYTAKQTLEAAQSLYMKKLTTYPRTDSQYLTTDAVGNVQAMIPSLIPILEETTNWNDYSFDISNMTYAVNDSKVNDHHAIIPDFNYSRNFSTELITDLPTSEKNVFFLVLFRLLSALSAKHLYSATTITIDAAGTQYIAHGKTDIEPGFTAVLAKMKPVIGITEKPTSTPTLPPLQEGEMCSVNITIQQKFTQPPRAYTEKTLLDAMRVGGCTIDDPLIREAMRDKGLGTPATRADIIEEIKRNGYAEVSGRSLIPTNLAYAMISVVAEPIKNPETTSRWEYQLSLIQQGSASKDDFLGDVKQQLTSIIDAAKHNSPAPQAGSFDRPSVGKCPKCGKRVIEYSKAFSCESGKNGCGFVIWKSTAGKAISSIQAKRILEQGKSTLLKGFTSKAGKKFDAYLVLKEDFHIGFEFPK